MLGGYLFLLKLLECAFGNTVSFIFFPSLSFFLSFFICFVFDFVLFCFIWGQVSLHCSAWPQVVLPVTKTMLHHACKLSYQSLRLCSIMPVRGKVMLQIIIDIWFMLYWPIFRHFCLRRDSKRRGVHVLMWSSREVRLQTLFCGASSQNPHLIMHDIKCSHENISSICSSLPWNLSPACALSHLLCVMNCAVPSMRKAKNRIVGFCALENHSTRFQRGLASSHANLISAALHSKEPDGRVALCALICPHQLQLEHHPCYI